MQYIKEGMSWGQAIGVINEIIDSMNFLKKAIGGCIVNEKIDYNALANLPTINGKTISGNETTESLGIGFSDDNLSQLKQMAEIAATNTANSMLNSKASANISQLENADADVSEICFFINDKNGTPKRIGIDTLTNYICSRIERKPEIVINNGSFKDLQKSVDSISATLKEFKETTALNFQENKNKFAAIEGNFANYSTTTDMNTAIKNKADALAGDISKIYATQGALNNVDAKFANYAKTTALDSYVTKTSLSTTLGDYAKTTVLAGYATTTALSDVDAKFANYAKTTALDSYVTKTSLSTTLGDYAKTTVLAGYAKTSVLAGYATTTALSDVDAKFANYAKTSALSSYVTKTSLSTTLGDYAKTTMLNNIVSAEIRVEELSKNTWLLDEKARTYKKYSTSSDLDLEISSSVETGIEHYLLIENSGTKEINISLAGSKTMYAETTSITLEAGSLIELRAIDISDAIAVTVSSNLVNK